MHTLRSRSESCQANGEVLETTGTFLKVPSPSLRKGPKGPMPLVLSCCFVAPDTLPRLRHIEFNDCFLEEPLTIRGWAFSFQRCLVALGRSFALWTVAGAERLWGPPEH